MKDLAKTIDKILSIEPALETKLTPIKNKFRRYPRKVMDYWQELLTVLNNDLSLRQNPRRDDIRKVLITSKKPVVPIYSFKEITARDRVVGVIPENIADKVRSHDRHRIELAKRHAVAESTDSDVLRSEVTRKGAILEIDQAKLWFILKDHFNLWVRKEGQFQIKKQGPVLVLTEPKESGGGQYVIQTPMGMIKLDENALRNMFKSMGMPPPPFLNDNGDNDD